MIYIDLREYTLILSQVKIQISEYKDAVNVTDLLSVITNALIFPSRGEARKMINAGGVSINKEII